MIPMSQRSRKKVLGERREVVVQDFAVVVQALPTCKSEPGSMMAGTKSTTEVDPTAARRLPGRESAK